MSVPRFEIFKGSSDKKAIWVESLGELSAANKRMKELADESPGAYFVFDVRARQILISLDTTNEWRRPKKSQNYPLSVCESMNHETGPVLQGAPTGWESGILIPPALRQIKHGIRQSMLFIFIDSRPRLVAPG